MQNTYIALQYPTVPAPLSPLPPGLPLTQRLSEDAGFLHVYLRDGLNLIEPFRTPSLYAGFLVVQYHLLCDLRRLYADEDVWQVIPDPGLSDPGRAGRLEADLHDLGAWPVEPVLPASLDGLELMAALGWLHAAEGLMLSLEMMAQSEAEDLCERLDLDASRGGRHLLAPLGTRTRAWRSLARALDSGHFSHEQGTEFVAGASLAYQRLDELLSLVLVPRA